MIGDEARDWLTTETANLIAKGGLDSYVAQPLVEANDQWFPDEWHADDGGVVRLAKRVFEHAGMGDVEITAELAKNAGSRGILPTTVDDKRVVLLVDPDFLSDPLTNIALLVRLAAVVFRVRQGLEAADPDQEHRLIDLTTVYLGFGILTTNAAYRYRASGELRGNTAITRWSHDVQGTLPADMMAYALATQLVAREASAGEIKSVGKQLETNQRDVYETATRQLRPAYVQLALNLPARSKWPAMRAAPPAPTSTLPKLWRREASALPVAVVKSKNYLGHNSGRAVLRMRANRRWEYAFVAMFLSMFAAIPIAVKGYGGAAMGAMIAIWVGGFVAGKRAIRETCSDSQCEMKLKASDERCPRCGGDIRGTVLPGENRLEAEERLGLNQGDYDMDVGEPSASASLPRATIEAAGRNARVDDGSTSTSVR